MSKRYELIEEPKSNSNDYEIRVVSRSNGKKKWAGVIRTSSDGNRIIIDLPSEYREQLSRNMKENLRENMRSIVEKYFFEKDCFTDETIENTTGTYSEINRIKPCCTEDLLADLFEEVLKAIP